MVRRLSKPRSGLDTVGHHSWQFASSEVSTVANRPYLTVSYYGIDRSDDQRFGYTAE